VTGTREPPLGERISTARMHLATLARETPPVPPSDAWLLPAHVDELIEWCASRADRLGDSGVACAEELVAIATELDAEAERRREARLAGCLSALTRLTGIGDTAELLRQSCEEATRRCGFARIVLSRVDGTTWRPWLGYALADDDLESWFPKWIDREIELDWRLPEARLLTDHRAIVVRDTSTTSVHREMVIDAGRSISYVVAPIVHHGTVIGFLHADHHPTGRVVDDVDRAVIWAYAIGLSHIYERTLLEERLRERRDETHGILSTAVERIDALSRDIRDDRVEGRSIALSELTAREYEVFRLMAEGATNGAIAARLVISEDTVKSHVKRILRKLGAANRSQAVAWTVYDQRR
jgi:DNA-binding CsgD family transcriptional regulator